MKTTKLSAAIATAALVVCVPFATVYPGAAAAPYHATQPARAIITAELAVRAAATSRLSGLAYGGAALEQPPTAPPENLRAVINAQRAALNAERAARAAATARLSGVPCGGAALYL